MKSERFRPLLDAGGPFVSIVFDDTHDTQDAAAQLGARMRDVRKHLEEQAVDPAVIAAIDAAVHAAHPPVGRSGRAIIAAGTRIVLDEHLLTPPVSTVLRVSGLPYLLPIVTHGAPHTGYLTVAVDHTGADIEVHDGTSRTETVEGTGYPVHETVEGTGYPVHETVEGTGYPVHKAHKAETAGYGGPQGRVDEAVRTNLREVADRVTHLVDQTRAEVVFLTGDARAELAAELPERVHAVQVRGGGRAAGTDPAEVHREIGAEFAARRQAVINDAAARLAAGRGTGLAVEGLAEVTAALRDGAVDTLIIGEVGDATLVADHDELALIGTDADTVSDLGGSPDRVLRADEALPMLAVATGAALVAANAELSPADGVAAVLRYAEMSTAG